VPKLANSLFGQKVRSRNTIRSLRDLPDRPFAQQLGFKDPLPILQLLRGPGLIRNAVGGWALLKGQARALRNPRKDLITGPRFAPKAYTRAHCCLVASGWQVGVGGGPCEGVDLIAPLNCK
jgi:hypothetical protein